MTDADFFAAMAVGIPPINAPTRIGLDLATGSDTTVVAEVAADGTITRMATIPHASIVVIRARAANYG
ncbi:hypothetical protein NJH49_08800 [Stenotrophomonas maltophilia]|uniref:hypothetical protein n=1 Tax=Stenotrophomonas maltophilia TaxID=40324 RepID=UPI002096CA1E|nr:hypothetical protein [Stenotrophomonas maltophilia]MCO7398280.1 hypothetical protein [Stenotrophomonas maltophilia]MCO7411482.1 hypothetical protein [Stenotrophomonas maltophilia]